MEKLITGAFAEVLKRNRERFNTKFAYARRRYPALEAEDFFAHLRLVVEPIINTIAQQQADKTDDVADALYDISLELIGKGLMGERMRYPAMLMGWNQLFNALPNLLISDAAWFAGAVSNAIYNLSVTPNTRITYWVDAMTEMGKHCASVQTFLDLGKIIAWRCGMAHYRMGALEVCSHLEPSLARAALLIPQEETTPIETVVERLQQDPWLAPLAASKSAGWSKTLRVVAKAGAFRGFGGDFISPPEVAMSEGEFIVFDDEHCWMLTVDLFGATLHRLGSSIPPLDSKFNNDFFIDKDGRVTDKQQRASFPQLAGASSFASNQTTLAITLPLSHVIYLIAQTEH